MRVDQGEVVLIIEPNHEQDHSEQWNQVNQPERDEPLRLTAHQHSHEYQTILRSTRVWLETNEDVI